MNNSIEKIIIIILVVNSIFMSITIGIFSLEIYQSSTMDNCKLDISSNFFAKNSVTNDD